MLNDLFGFRGRVGRLHFLGLWMLQGVVVAIAIVLGALIGVPLLSRHNPAGLAPMLGVFVIALWTWLAISAKRLSHMGVPDGFRRYVYLAWFFYSGVMALALSGQPAVIKIVVGQAPLLALLVWPGRGQPGAPGAAPERERRAPGADWASQIDFSKPLDPFPAAAGPAPAATAPRPAFPAASGPRTTFGRRGL